MALSGRDQPDYERSDVSLRLIAAIGAGVALLFVATPLVLRAVYPHPPAIARTTIPPAPRLQRDPAADLAAYRAAQTTRLTETRWVDRDAGLARIPIEDAMRLLADRGRPGWPGGAR